jgi:hypothetical protein
VPSFNVRLEGLGRQRLSTPQDSSQAEPTSTPEAISDQQSSGGSLREVSMNGGRCITHIAGGMGRCGPVRTAPVYVSIFGQSNWVDGTHTAAYRHWRSLYALPCRSAHLRQLRSPIRIQSWLIQQGRSSESHAHQLRSAWRSTSREALLACPPFTPSVSALVGPPSSTCPAPPSHFAWL